MPDRRLKRLSLTTLVVLVLVILWGVVVRATGSGAGCGDHWPTCNGEIIPQPKTIATLIEVTHRLQTALLAVFVVAQIWATRVWLPKSHPIARAALWTGIFTVTESLVGAAIVLLKKVAMDSSPGRAGWIALHLTNTFLLLGTQTLVWWWARGGVPIDWSRRRAIRREIVPLVLVVIVAIAGAIVALGDTLFPSTSLAQGMAADVATGAHFLIRLRVIHPLIAVVVGLGVAARAMMMAGDHPPLANAGRTVAALVFAQLALGLLNFVLLAPTWMQLVHLFVADLVWMAMVVFASEAIAHADLLDAT